LNHDDIAAILIIHEEQENKLREKRLENARLFYISSNFCPCVECTGFSKKYSNWCDCRKTVVYQHSQKHCSDFHPVVTSPIYMKIKQLAEAA
jgi:hypothetical protein